MRKTIEMLSRLWEDEHAERFGYRLRKEKRLANGKNYFQVLFDFDRQRYQSTPKPAHCPFDIMDEGKVLGKQMAYGINIYPYFPMHLIAYPLQHREEPAANDMLELWSFARISGMAGFLNLRDSGAGIPEHVHYHLIPPVLPLFDAASSLEKRKRDMSLRSMDFSAEAYRLKTDNLDAAVNLALAYEHAKNVIVHEDSLYLIPRTEVFSPVAPGWKIAAAEVAGFFIPRDEELYDSMDFGLAKKIIEDTTPKPKTHIGELCALM
jgi:diadenosine tetraphosphate (Ap4A) HIT family hydrolase